MKCLTSIEVFLSDDDQGESIGLVLRDPSILEYEGDLTSGCTMSPDQARRLSAGLLALAAEAEES